MKTGWRDLLYMDDIVDKDDVCDGHYDEIRISVCDEDTFITKRHAVEIIKHLTKVFKLEESNESKH